MDAPNLDCTTTPTEDMSQQQCRPGGGEQCPIQSELDELAWAEDLSSPREIPEHR